MSKQQSGSSRRTGIYVRELRLSLRNNAGAYGYSVMITSCLATLSATKQSPQVHEIILFILGAVASFALVETIASRGFQRSLRSEEPTQVVALGSALNFVAILVAIGATALVGTWVAAPVSWVVGSFVASVTYLMVTSIEMALARRIEQKRGLR